MPGLQIQFDNGNMDRVKQLFNQFVQELNKNGTIDLKLNTALIKEDLMKTTSDIDKVVEKYKQLGEVKDIKQNFDNNGNLDSFIIKLERTKGLLETIRYDAIQNGSISTTSGNPQAVQFGVTDITQQDNRIKLAQKMAEVEVKAEDDVQNAIAKTIQEREKLNIADQNKQADVSNKNIEEQKQEEDNNDKLIEQENNKLKVLQMQWDKKIEILKVSADQLKNDELNSKIDTLQNSVNGTVSTGAVGQQELKGQYQDIITLQQKLNDEKIQEQKLTADAIAQQLKDADAIQTTVDKEQARIQGLGQLKTTFSSDLFSKSNADIEKYVQSIYGAQAKITSFKRSLDDADSSAIKMTVTTKNNKDQIEQESIILDKNTNSMYKNNETIKEASMNMGGFIDRLKNAFVAVTSFATVTTGFYAVIQQIQSGIQMINDLNASQTNIQMITGMTSTETKQLTKDYSDLASTLHETTSEVMTASEEFLRAGNNQKDTANLLQSSTVMSKIAGQSQADSAQSLISIMNAYKLSASDMISVVDKMVAVDNTSATSTAELSAAIQKTASSAQASGVSLSQLISWIGTISSVTRQSADSIGTSLNSIFSRYENVAAGKLADADNQPLNNVEKVLNQLGISIRTNKNTFADFNTVLNSLSANWSKYSQVQQAAAATAIAGTRQHNQFLALMQNMNMALSMQTTEASSAGNAMERYQTYSKSTAAVTADLTNALQKMWMSMINSSIVNSVIQDGTKIVGVLQEIVNTSTSTKVEMVALGIAIILIFKNIKMAILDVATSTTQITVLDTILKLLFGTSVTGASIIDGLTVAFTGLKTVLTTLFFTPQGLAILAVVTAIGLLTKGIIDNIQHQKEIKSTTDSLTKSYQDLTTAMKANDVQTIKSSSDDLVKTQTTLMDAIKKRADAEKQLQDIENQNDTNNPMRQSQIGALRTEIIDSNKVINDTTTELKGAGIAFNSTTGSIDKLVVAQQQLKENVLIDTINKEAEATQKHDNDIINLINEYRTLSAIENKSITDKERMTQLTGILSESINGLVIVKDKDGNATIQNTVLLGKSIDMLNTDITASKTNANVKLETAKNNAQAQVGETQVVYSEIVKRIKMYQEEENALNALNQSLQNVMNNTTDEKSYNLASHRLATGQGIAEGVSANLQQLNDAKNAIDVIFNGGNGANGFGSGGDVNSNSDGSYMPPSSTKTKSTPTSTAETSNGIELDKYQSIIDMTNDKLKTLTNTIDITKQKITNYKALGTDDGFAKSITEENNLLTEQNDKLTLLKSNSTALDNGLYQTVNHMQRNFSQLNGVNANTIKKYTEQDFLNLEASMFPTTTWTGKEASTEKAIFEARKKDFETSFKDILKFQDAITTTSKDVLTAENDITSTMGTRTTEITAKITTMLQAQQKLQLAQDEYNNYDGETKKQWTASNKEAQDAIQTQIDNLNTANNLQTEIETRLKNQNDLIQKQTQLQTDQYDKSTQVMTQNADGSWGYTYVSDATKVEADQKAVQDQITSNNDWEKQTALKHTTDALSAEKKALADDQTARDTAYQVAQDTTNAYYTDMNSLALTSLATLQATYGNNWDAIVKKVTDSVTAIKKENADLATAMATGAALAVTNSNSSSSSSRATNNGNGTVTYTSGNQTYTVLKGSTSDPTSSTFKGYAEGTSDATKGTHPVSENAMELVIGSQLKNFNGGESVIKGGLTSTLINFATSPLNYMQNLFSKFSVPNFSKVSKSTGDVINQYTFGDLVFPNAINSNEILSAIKSAPDAVKQKSS